MRIPDQPASMPLRTQDARPAASRDTRENIRHAAAGLEEALLRTTLQAMTRAQLESGGFFGSGSAEGTEQTTFEMMLSQTLAADAPLGVADQLADQLARRKGNLDAARDIAALGAGEMPLRSGTGSPIPAAAPPAVFKTFTPGPQGRANPSDEFDGNSRTGRSPAGR